MFASSNSEGTVIIIIIIIYCQLSFSFAFRACHSHFNEDVIISECKRFNHVSPVCAGKITTVKSAVKPNNSNYLWNYIQFVWDVETKPSSMHVHASTFTKFFCLVLKFCFANCRWLEKRRPRETKKHMLHQFKMSNLVNVNCNSWH